MSSEESRNLFILFVGSFIPSVFVGGNEYFGLFWENSGIVSLGRASLDVNMVLARRKPVAILATNSLTAFCDREGLSPSSYRNPLSFIQRRSKPLTQLAWLAFSGIPIPHE